MNEQDEEALIQLLKGIVEVQGIQAKNIAGILTVLENITAILENPQLVINKPKKWFGLF